VNVATIRYTGDRPFFMVKVDPVGRLTFNQHNAFTQSLPVDACISLLKQYRTFFTIDQGATGPSDNQDDAGKVANPGNLSSLEYLLSAQISERVPAPHDFLLRYTDESMFYTTKSGQKRKKVKRYKFFSTGCHTGAGHSKKLIQDVRL
jgi:hypothetical protein